MGGMLRWQSCSTSDFPLKPSKVAAACQPCRTKKMRCDGRQPCNRCVKDDKNCEYRPSTTISRNNTRRNSNNKSSHTHKQHSPKFQWSKLKKLTFHQDLYAALNLSASPLSSKSGKLPPLLLEFYHLTAQPITIWTRMHVLFLKWFRLQKSPSLYSIRIPADVVKEALHLFFKYNTLYTLFIDPADITPALNLDPFFPSTITTANNNNKSINPAASLLLDTILALTFLAAGQTIGSDMLLDVARFFYDTVHQRWLAMTFPSVDINHHSSPPPPTTTTTTFNSSLKNNTSNNNSSSSSLKLSTQTAILLIHFQCTAICEEQAYMTSRIAQGCLERLLSMDQIKSETQQNQQQHDHIALQYTLHAWQIWFALYLYDGQSLISPIAKHTPSIASPSPPMLPLSSSPLAQQQNQEQQLWTWTVLTRYTIFLESLLKANQDSSISIQNMKNKSQALGTLSIMNKKSITATSPTTLTTCSEQLVGLYHTILTIQLFSTQWLPHLDFFIPASKSDQRNQQIKHTDNNTDRENGNGGADDDVDLSKKICFETSQRVIQMVSAMMMTGQYITAHRSSSPLLLFIRYRALCFASVILVSLAQQQLTTNDSFSTHLDDSLHQLKQIIEKDIQVWPMARQCLYYLHQRMPSHFDPPDITTDDGFLSNFDGIDGSNSFILDDQQERSLQTTATATSMMMNSYSLTTRGQRHWHGMNNRDHIDREQLNKLSLHHDQLSEFATMKKRNMDQRNDALLYHNQQQQSVSEDIIYSRKRHQTFPAAATTPTSNYWLSYSLGGNNVGGPGPYLMLGNEDHSSMLLSVSSSTGSSASTSTALSQPAMAATSKPSPPVSTVSSTFALSATTPMVPMLSTTYPTPLQQQMMCVSQSVMTSIPTTSIPSTNTEENNSNNNASFDLVQPSSTPSTYHQNHSVVQQQQAMTAIEMPPMVPSSISDTSNLLPSYQSSINNNKRPLMTWQYQTPPTRQLLHDTFTASIMETLHDTHDSSMIPGTGESHSLPPAPASSPIDTPTPSYLDDVHLQTVSRGLAHHASSMSLTRTESVDSTASNNLISSDDRHTQEWLYLLYQQQQQQRQYLQQPPSPLPPPPPPPPPSEPSTATASTDDPFMLFSSSLPSLPRK